ncbi:MAG: flagellar basal body-associated FliL family protein [Steroidobacteraceae bacterium]|nr:flagellar basal body-associated FliL family protein [Nevskiaceae bacterium]MCP5339089.1 flagellar basal body-associated FliL family protein [Nevskiaceae bacterium]MCP5359998.1 flagellar basal body-associated FliL family protein [Nevskiaceae bacterium]MCP5466928.1 flagellar basal body-associated FliL family protein [Nevskiaceae bacterium]MCP5472182.1 flagellar basal body-associated FliL family protein [Nevskiaceae bacterium]
MANAPVAAVELADGVPPSKKKRILIAAVALFVLGGAAGGFYFWKSGQDGGNAAAEASKPLPPLQFLPLDPPFVVNFSGQQTVRFLQIEVRLASREPRTIELMRANEPVIRNDLLLLFGQQQASELATREGKEKLRAAALEQVRKIVKAEAGSPESIDNVYFTSFVMQ